MRVREAVKWQVLILKKYLNMIYYFVYYFILFCIYIWDRNVGEKGKQNFIEFVYFLFSNQAVFQTI